MSKETRFHLPLPLDVEPVLEGLLSTQVMTSPFRARSYAAGEFVAQLIRAAADDEKWKRAGKAARAALPTTKKGRVGLPTGGSPGPVSRSSAGGAYPPPSITKKKTRRVEAKPPEPLEED